MFTVETLVRNWAPLVWLAPGEKFLPGDVKEFFNHVHAEKTKTQTKYAGNEVNNYYYYDADNDELAALVQENKNWERRNKRNFKARNFLVDYIIDLPIGEDSENWYLVTNKGIGNFFDSFYFELMPSGNLSSNALFSIKEFFIGSELARVLCI